MKTLPAIALTALLAFAAGLAVAEFVLPRGPLSSVASLSGRQASIGGSDAARGGADRLLPFGPDHLPTDTKGMVDALIGLKRSGDDLEFHTQLYGLIKQTTSMNIQAVVEGFLKSPEKSDDFSYVTAALFNRWVRLDPKTAMAGLKEISDRDTKYMAVYEALAGWVSVDFEAANRWVEALPPGENKIEAERSLLENLAKADPHRALELAMQDFRAGMDSATVDEIFERLAGQDPHAAAEDAAGLPAGKMRTAAMTGVAMKWADTDPEAALNLVDTQLQGADRVNMAGVVFTNWGRRDFDAALAYLRQQPMNTPRSELAERFTAQIAMEDPAKALQVVDLIAPREQDSFLAGIAGDWARQSPADAEAWAKSQTDPTVAKAVWSGIISGLENYPQDAAALALQLPEDQQSAAINQVLQGWTDRAPAAAAAWVAGLPKDQQPGAVRQIAEKWAFRDPASAIAWASGLSDPALQVSADKEVLERWVGDDPQPALQWFSQMPAGAPATRSSRASLAR